MDLSPPPPPAENVQTWIWGCINRRFQNVGIAKNLLLWQCQHFGSAYYCNPVLTDDISKERPSGKDDHWPGNEIECFSSLWLSFRRHSSGGQKALLHCPLPPWCAGTLEAVDIFLSHTGRINWNCQVTTIKQNVGKNINLLVTTASAATTSPTTLAI